MRADDTLFAHFGAVGLDHDNKYLYRGFLSRQLCLNRCTSCGHWQHPPVPMCPACWSTDIAATPVHGRGTIVLLTIMHQGPPTPGVDYATPYAVGSVELDEAVGLRFTSAIVSSDGRQPTIGSVVELQWIERNGAPFPIFGLSP
jgi:uncharacterized OB-fold protein